MQNRYQAHQASPDFFHIVDSATLKCVGFAASVRSALDKIRILERTLERKRR